MYRIALILITLFFTTPIFTQNLEEDSLKYRISESLTNIYHETLQRPGKILIDSIELINRDRNIRLYTNLSLSYLPMRESLVLQIYDSVRYFLPERYKKRIIEIYTDGVEVSHLIPNFHREKNKDRNRLIVNKVNKPLVIRESNPAGEFEKGLQNNHIALWQSHGWYYEQKLGRWEWQRARIFRTVEDLYTQSYVVPFLVPMLENAGANVLLPRERDYNKAEIIVDNEGKSHGLYRETTGKESWYESDSAGFANMKDFYVDGENPFRMGSARQIKSISRGAESVAEWIPEITENGEYGVYVSYQTLKNSSDDALYSVYHSGGKSDFRVNQTMGGGTWIFLGYFKFNTEENNKITLSNKGRKAGKIVTADAVKIGGGMGNIARMPHPEGMDSENIKSSDDSALSSNKLTGDSAANRLRQLIKYAPEISSYPRYTEGARYWMQWAGVPDSIYNRNESKNDYTDDYSSRGAWVNWLAGGSSVLPEEQGLNIPLDLAFAFHSDAGTFWGDTIVGTLGIYMTHFNDEVFENGKSRWASRDLTELIMDEIVSDIRREFEPDWTRRHLWNRSYAEARMPNVPTMLLELLSHQNFADMRYGLDPAFRFLVSRSIYKGMLKFIATQYNRPFAVQPLPVKDFSAVFSGDTEVLLNWQPSVDESEPTAFPAGYIVYTRVDDGGFDDGVLVNSNNYNAEIKKGHIYSFKVAAINEGGISFPSEILSVCKKSEEKGVVLIVNGFTRISAPFSFTTSEDSIAGFAGSVDNGVPYIADYHFTGQMHEFRRVIPWMDDDASGFGDSDANFETTKIAGNTFDYPYVHGKAFADAGYSFVSSAASSVVSGKVKMGNYETVDWILGKQREWVVARGAKPPKFKTFSENAQQLITDFCNSGGNIIVSGAFVGSDLWDNPYADKEDRDWARNTLKYKWRNNNGAVTGKIKSVPSPFNSVHGNYNYFNTLNSKGYAVENPDAIEPADNNAFTILRYSENNLSAGVLYKGDDYNSCILGFPIESITDQENINKLIENVMRAFNEFKIY